jgi:hypothetical protein
LTAIDSTAAFLSFSKIVSSDTLSSVLGVFNKEAQAGLHQPIQQVQNPFIQQWFQEDRVATLEFIQWSKGIIDPAPNTSYVLMLGGTLVSSAVLHNLKHIQSGCFYSILRVEALL